MSSFAYGQRNYGYYSSTTYDLTNFSVFVGKYTAVSTSYTQQRISVLNTSLNVVRETNISPGTFTMDITDLSGEYYLCHRMPTSGSSGAGLTFSFNCEYLYIQ